MSLVGWIGESDAGVEVAGGKAASLARLARMGLPTPSGFVVAAGAFEAYLEAAGAMPRVRELVASLPDADAAAELECLATRHVLPQPLASDLGAAVERLTGGDLSTRLAVRSSAQAEDASDTSFAGQHETVLGVTACGFEAALRRCWASLWSERCVAYRAAQGMSPAAPAEMAVLVQPLVEAVASAVVFTVNPVSGDREEVVVEATRGLGEKIVSGGGADVIVLDRATLAPRELVAEDGEVVAANNGHAPLAVSIAQAAELAELALRAERGFRSPLDVEAAHDGERWLLLQARPITTGIAGAARDAVLIAGGAS